MNLANQVEKQMQKTPGLLEIIGVWLLTNALSLLTALSILNVAKQTGYTAFVGLASHIPQFIIPYIWYRTRISPILPVEDQSVFRWKGKLRFFLILGTVMAVLNFFDSYNSAGSLTPPWIASGGLSICLMIVFQGVFVGLCEEMMFRPAFHLPLLILFPKTKIPWPMIITALAFGGMHLSNFFLGQPIGSTLLQSASAIVLGLIFGWFYQKTRNYLGTALLHNLFDVAGTLALWLAFTY